jgi:tRNA(Ile)-lysidine synthase
VLPALRELNPAAERNIAETAAQLREEAELLDELTPAGPLTLQRLRELPPALARLALRAASGTHVTRDDAARVLALPPEGTHAVDLPGGVRAVSEYGALRFASEPEPAAPEPVPLPVPGAAEFGRWRLEAAVGGRGDVLLDPRVAQAGLVVRGWRHGDRMRPFGLDGTKTLQDLFTDRKVPRAQRASVPVIEVEGEIAWVAGLAVGERFRAEASPAAVAVTARRLAP